MEDEHLRQACFARLQLLEARFGTDVPYVQGLREGFPFAGRRVPFLSPQKGIFRARVQAGAAALSINTSMRSPYADRQIPDGFLYAYRAGNRPSRQPCSSRSFHNAGANRLFQSNKAGVVLPCVPVLRDFGRPRRRLRCTDPRENDRRA